MGHAAASAAEPREPRGRSSEDVRRLPRAVNSPMT